MTDDVDEKKKTCPDCGNGRHGKDSLCDDHWHEYLGTHRGGRGEDHDSSDSSKGGR